MPDTFNTTHGTVDQSKPGTVVCRVCGAGPLGGVPLFANGRDDDSRPKLFCAQHLSLTALLAQLERREGPMLDPDVRAVFTRRLAESRQ